MILYLSLSWRGSADEKNEQTQQCVKKRGVSEEIVEVGLVVEYYGDVERYLLLWCGEDGKTTLLISFYVAKYCAGERTR